ncbi:MAG: UDP-4-amino-4,6-dideoxy-N-acetyl-beta-L-altrosamine transaminase [Pseudomonadota bacterium]
MIPYGRQDVVQSDIDAVEDVLRSDFLTQGPVGPRFERAVAQSVGAACAVAVNSATSALHVACLALRLGPGDRLWTVPTTFVASANCGLYCGADVDFVDIDPDTWNLSVERLREKLAEAGKEHRLPKVVVPVHLAGQPTEQEAIRELSREYGFSIVEDASHAIGASRNGEPVGSCRWSDVTVFSFHPVKIMTSGEGGMALTNDDEIAERMRLLRSHGITRDPERFSSSGPVSGWYYEQQMLGFNYRMTDIQSALGLSQLQRVPEYVDRRNELARRYDEALRELPLQLPLVQPGNVSAFHLYVVRLTGGVSAAGHRQVFDALRSAGLGVNVHYMPVHLQPYYRQLGFSPGQYPEAEAYGNSAITLPLYPNLTEQQQDEVIRALGDAL